MYSREERLNLFRDECRRYSYYCSRISLLEDELTIVTTKMVNLSSPSMDRIGSNPNQGQMSNLIHLIETKNKIETEIKALQRITRWITDCIERIPYPSYKYIIWRTMIEREKLTALSDLYGVSYKILSQNRRKCILMILNDEAMSQYDRIAAELKASK